MASNGDLVRQVTTGFFIDRDPNALGKHRAPEAATPARGRRAQRRACHGLMRNVSAARRSRSSRTSGSWGLPRLGRHVHGGTVGPASRSRSPEPSDATLAPADADG